MSRKIARDNYSGYAEINHPKYQDTSIWNQSDGDTWRLVHNCQVVAEIDITTKSKRINDLSGFKKFKVLTEHFITITYRIGYKSQITLNTERYTGGLKAALLHLIELFENGWFDQIAKYKAFDLAHKAGATDYELIKAEDAYRFDASENEVYRQQAINLYKLYLRKSQ